MAPVLNWRKQLQAKSIHSHQHRWTTFDFVEDEGETRERRSAESSTRRHDWQTNRFYEWEMSSERRWTYNESSWRQRKRNWELERAAQMRQREGNDLAHGNHTCAVEQIRLRSMSSHLYDAVECWSSTLQQLTGSLLFSTFKVQSQVSDSKFVSLHND